MGGPGRRQPRHIAQIMAGISQKRHRARDDPKPSLDQDEDQIQDRAYCKGRAEIDRGGVVVAQVKAVPMIMVMVVVTMVIMMLMPMPVIMVMIVVTPMIVVIMIMRVGFGSSAGHGV